MYQNIRTCAKTPEGINNNFRSFVGVKQDCNLSPNHFNIFVNDIPDIFSSECDPIRIERQNLNCLLYADDFLLLSESSRG